jgi:serine/threonine-protein kinase RsbW
MRGAPVIDVPVASNEDAGPELPAWPRAGLRLRLSTRVEDVPYARAAVTRLCEHLGFDLDVTERIRVAVTEACTNCVRHAYQPAERAAYVLDARLEGQMLRVAVRDRGVGFSSAVRGASNGPGSGLRLIRGMADSAEVTSRLGRGTHVVMHFEIR